MEKTLIIKTGHCETFYETDDQGICSLGDILRSTFICNSFENITWVTDKKAIKLLEYSNIDKIIDIEEFDFNTLFEYKIIINLEKKSSILEKIGQVRGINFDNFSFVHELMLDTELSYQEKLCKLLNIEWTGQHYSFDYPSIKGTGIGLNWKSGVKIPEKQLPKKFWTELEKLAAPKYQVKWQKGFEDISEYIDWINSCDTIITLDSLGIHIALALGKKIICLFGATNPNEVYLYNQGAKINHSLSMGDQEMLDKRKEILEELERLDDMFR
ncbi:MAG: hypothetical protein HN576_12535 [Bacteriovoracaceae bacterium]|nr:hypothetical protein [Bacteriovoracaceae bacterium]